MATEPTIALLRSAPYFPVHDLRAAIDYYDQRLGFHAEYVGGTPPEFAIVSRDNLAIMLRRVPRSMQIFPNPQQGGTWDAFFWVCGAQELHAELEHRGAEIAYAPTIQPAYQMVEFAVRDGEGHVLGFGEAMRANGESADG